jgi:thermospermine synthase
MSSEMPSVAGGTTTSAPSGIGAQRAKAGFHFREDMAPGLVVEMTLKQLVHSTKSKYQQIDVIETHLFGKTLVTDGKTQSTQFDEFAYHESLVHPALLNFSYYNKRPPRTVFIGGGGELATAREVLRHPGVEKVVMVDIDEEVVNVSALYLPEWGGEAVKNDPRLQLIIGDAYQYLLDCKEETFDVIIMDISDPIEAGPGIMLYTKELYQHAASLLSPNGVFVTQSGPADSIPLPHANADGRTDTTCFGPIQNTLREVFPCVMPYTQPIPSFGCDWGFVMAFSPIILVQEGNNNSNSNNNRGDSKRAEEEEWSKLGEVTIDNLIETCITGGEKSLRMYDGITHGRMYALSKATRNQLKADTRIMTKANPVFMY